MHLPGPRAALKRRVLFLPFLLALLVCVLAGCDLPRPPVPGKPTPTLSPPTPTHPPRPQGGTLTVRLASDVSSLNPWLAGNDAPAQAVTGMIFGGLTHLDNHLQPQPDLADRWDVSEDGTALTFHLRQDVRWHDGRPFTADDVVWSYKTLAQLPPATSAAAHFQDTVASVQAVDPVSYTVRFTLRRRYSPILADLAMPILPAHILSGTAPDKLAGSPFNGAPVGTGPFTFEKHEPGQSLVLKSNPAYYGGQPPIVQVAFLVAPDDKVAEEAVKDGSLLLAQVPPDAAERLVAGGGSMRGGSYDEPGFDFVAFNLRATSVFSDTRLRQAWALALDKPGLVFAATGGTGDPVWTDVPKASWAYNSAVPQLGGKPQEARMLLQQAGWTDTNGDGIVDRGGKPLEVTLYVRTDDPTRRKAADNMAEQLGRVGIRVKVQAADFNTALLARLSPNSNPPFDFDAMLLGWTRLGVDPDPFALFHSSQVPTQAQPGLLNFTGFSAPEYDDRAINGRSIYDYGERKQIYARTQEIVADQLPYYFLWARKYGVVAGPRLHGDIDFSSPLYLWNVDQWWIE
jgi:peptide/nickel transport system substrate-binding protein